MDFASSLANGKLFIGLTGGIGSGKTSVANAFAKHGATIVDTDHISHQLTAPSGRAIPSIKSVFGEEAINDQGALDRPKMRNLVFSDATAKTKLEAILHPMISDEVLVQARLATGPYVICVVPLLVESGRWKFQRVLVVDCDVPTQIKRVSQRDGLPLALINSIISQQATREQRLSVATEVIINQGEFSTILPEIDRLHQMYYEISTTN